MLANSRFLARWRRLGLLMIVSTAMMGNTLKPTPWSWKETPLGEDWQTFESWSVEERSRTWSQLEQDGITLGRMSWEWRLAWVRSCRVHAARYRNSVLQLALFDKAMIVRSETASLLGQIFANTAHLPVLKLLESAFGVSQNFRRGEPLFVQYRILQAIEQVGGPESREIGERLARQSDGTVRYWSLLAARS